MVFLVLMSWLMTDQYYEEIQRQLEIQSLFLSRRNKKKIKIAINSSFLLSHFVVIIDSVIILKLFAIDTGTCLMTQRSLLWYLQVVEVYCVPVLVQVLYLESTLYCSTVASVECRTYKYKYSTYCTSTSTTTSTDRRQANIIIIQQCFAERRRQGK